MGNISRSLTLCLFLMHFNELPSIYSKLYILIICTSKEGRGEERRLKWEENQEIILVQDQTCAGIGDRKLREGEGEVEMSHLISKGKMLCRAGQTQKELLGALCHHDQWIKWTPTTLLWHSIGIYRLLREQFSQHLVAWKSSQLWGFCQFHCGHF